MNERVIAIFDGGVLGPFDDEEQAYAYFGSLDIEGKIVPLTAPPAMSALLAWAVHHIISNGEDLEGFLGEFASDGSARELREAFEQALVLGRLTVVNEDLLTDEELAVRLYKQLGNSKILTIKELRIRRVMDLRKARDTVLKALDASGLL